MGRTCVSRIRRRRRVVAHRLRRLMRPLVRRLRRLRRVRRRRRPVMARRARRRQLRRRLAVVVAVVARVVWLVVRVRVVRGQARWRGLVRRQARNLKRSTVKTIPLRRNVPVLRVVVRIARRLRRVAGMRLVARFWLSSGWRAAIFRNRTIRRSRWVSRYRRGTIRCRANCRRLGMRRRST